MKKVSKKVLSILLSSLLIVTLFPISAFAAKTSFSDVPKNAWFADAVSYVEDHGLMVGTSNTTFSPNTATTRGMIVSILYRMSGSPAVSGALGYPYADVDSKAYYAMPVYWARQQGIASGYDSNRFGPNDAITREQMARFLYQYSKFSGKDVSARGDLSGFKDGVKVSAWALESMQWAVAEKIFSGDEKGYLQPQGKATRAQVASVLMRYQNKANQPVTPPATTNPLPGNFPMKLTYSSGAGAWATEITLNADGTFSGQYYDFDYGVDKYPNGLCSYNNFHGTFGNIQKRDAHSYTMVLKDLHNDSKGTYIENGVGYEPVPWPCGLDNIKGNGLNQQYVFYVPETKTNGLAPSFLDWWPDRFGQPQKSELGYYAIENAETHSGFFGK